MKATYSAPPAASGVACTPVASCWVQRTVPSRVDAVVDINNVPQQLVSRVDIVTGGASAIYGSDAVTGVVNFVLNKKLEGLRVRADTGVTDKGDGYNYSGSISGGTAPTRTILATRLVPCRPT